MLRRFLFRLLFLALSVAFSHALAAQFSDTLAVSTHGLFDHLYTQGDEIVEVELQMDLKLLLRNRKKDDYQEARLIWGDAPDAQIALGVKPRGKLRRRLCDFPPLKLKVDKKAAKAQMLEDFRKLKLVTHCMHNNGSKNLVLREYLAYQLYRELTDASFKTQLVKVTYQDTQKPKRQWVRYGMLIEPNAQLAARLDGVLETRYYCHTHESVRPQEDLMAAFQMLIGNQDYTVASEHNVKWLRRGIDSLLMPVPYDFDYSGFVNAHYAVPLPSYPALQRITDRMYLGRAVDAEALEASLQLLADKREVLLARIAQFEQLPKYEREQLRRYLERFYERVDAEFCTKQKVLP